MSDAIVSSKVKVVYGMLENEAVPYITGSPIANIPREQSYRNAKIIYAYWNNTIY